MPVSTGYGRKGVPDIVGHWGFMALYIETKFGRNTLSPNQRQCCWEIAESGACMLIIDEKNVHQLHALMVAFRMRNSI